MQLFCFFSLLLPPFALSVLQVLCRGSGLTHVHHGRARECHLRPGDTPVFCAAGLHHTEVAMVGGECWDRVLRLHRILGYKGLVYMCVWEVSVCVCVCACALHKSGYIGLCALPHLITFSNKLFIEVGGEAVP